MRNLTVRDVLAFSVILFSFFSECCFSVETENEFNRFLSMMQAKNPQLSAARYRVEQALSRHEELFEFYDPEFNVAAGYTENDRYVPQSSFSSSLEDNRISAQAGVEAALVPGAYVSAGIEQARLFEESGYDHLFQNLFGVRVRIPLLRDKGFAIQNYKMRAAMAEYNMSVSAFLILSQQLRNQLEQVYLSCYEYLSIVQVVTKSEERFKIIAEEAKELADLKTVPDYEVLDTVRELQISREDLQVAKNAYEVQIIKLSELLGEEKIIELKGDVDSFVEKAQKNLKIEYHFTMAQALQARGISLYQKNRLERARANHEKALEEMRDDLSLEVGLNSRFENENHPYGIHRDLDDNYFGGDIAIVWHRPLGYCGEKSRLAQIESLLSEIKADMNTVKLQIFRELKQEELNYNSAKERMVLLLRGVEAAKKTMEAEQERFRLGDGSSNSVLDAQKNMTIILRRLTVAAADLLRSQSNYCYSAGYCKE
ncbi:MAG: TolC family protein [Lentisphaeria bacterium]